MLDRLESVSRLLCIGLGAVLVLELASALIHGNPLGNVAIPELPTLAASGGKAQPPSEKTRPAVTQSNALVSVSNAPSGKTNVASAGTNAPRASTNSPAASADASPALKLGNGAASQREKADLPASIQVRVDRVVTSEILGPFQHPLPMALLGIAGNDAFLRTSDGQTGMIKEGDHLGSIKLIRIGTNRALIEDNGESKELTLFAGMGGESLLPPQTNSTVGTNPAVKISKLEKHQ